MTDLTIKFPRPDGEARLSWCGHDCPDGGYVRVYVAETSASYHGPPGAEYVGNFLAEHVTDPAKRAEILKEAEKLRNERRRLGENEWRDESGTIWQFSRPTLGTDGSAGRMAWCRDNRIEVGCFHWWPGRDCASKPNHPALVAGQLARLQAFWDANQPKEVELNLRWEKSTKPCDVVAVEVAGVVAFYEGTFPPYLDEHLTPAQRATVEAFFAAGPPVELAEDEFLDEGAVRRMVISINSLAVSAPDGRKWLYPRYLLATFAKRYPSPLGWPRALAFLDKHTKPAEPERVTGISSVTVNGKRRVHFNYGGQRCGYGGDSDLAERFPGIHPLDIARIERCWKEGRLGEREVLFDCGTVGRITDFGYGEPGISTAERHVLLSGDWQESESPAHWKWSIAGPELAIHDPAQRARVRAIVAGMMQDQARQEALKLKVALATEPTPEQVADLSAATPSGEVKAPFGLEWTNRGEPGFNCELDFDGLSITVQDDGTWLASAFFERPSRDDPEKWLRRWHAALSDHIRRGDGVETDDRASMWETTALAEKERREQAEKAFKQMEDLYCDSLRKRFALEDRLAAAPDLTELREAWATRYDLGGLLKMNRAVERLVGK